MTDEELIARLRGAPADGLGTENLCIAAADRIEALVKERAEMEAEAHAHTKLWRVALREKAQEKAAAEARAERLEVAMIQMRDDRTAFRHAVHFRRFIITILKGADHE